MLITLKGLVLRETKVSDSARYITLLTEEHGKISVLVRGAMKPGSAASLPTKMFCFSEFVLYESHGKYRYNDATVIDSFFGLSGDYTAFILASYVVGAADFVTEEEQPDAGIYRLTLNTLWALTHLEKRDARIIKGAFEMRLAGYCGFAPNLFYCADCGKPVVEERVFLDVMNGCVRCADCAKLHNTAVYDDNDIKVDDMRTAMILLPLDVPVADALRYILAAGDSKIFSFTLADTWMPEFLSVCEKYLENHVEHRFEQLDMLDFD